jgi:hypothetical protein
LFKPKTDNLEKSQKNLKDIMVEFELMKIELQEKEKLFLNLPKNY